MATRIVQKFLLDGEEPPPGESSFVQLIPTQRYDFVVEQEVSQHRERLQEVTCPVLLAGGSKGPRYLTAALDHLQQLLGCSRTTLPGLGHTSSSNAGQGGHPDVVAAVVADFFASQDGAPAESPGASG